MAYVIKRYANRKLYDPQKSQYVTLEELEEDDPGWQRNCGDRCDHG